jgi:acetyl/propionyl-CoA carboxylase alpha subunit
LSFTQDDLQIKGHSIEVRVYAEDPLNNFLPDIGTLNTYKTPQGLGVRVDDGFEEGMQIPIYYDPMIAKLITFGKDREEARLRMIRAINDYHISGVETTLPFCNFVMQHEAFITGNFDTHFVKQYFNPDSLKPNLSEEELEITAIAASIAFQELNHEKEAEASYQTENNSWKRNRKSYMKG